MLAVAVKRAELLLAKLAGPSAPVSATTSALATDGSVTADASSNSTASATASTAPSRKQTPKRLKQQIMFQPLLDREFPSELHLTGKHQTAFEKKNQGFER